MSNEEQGPEPRDGHATGEGERSWAAARVIQEALSRHDEAMRTAVSDALDQAKVEKDVRQRVWAAFDKVSIEHLWTLALPDPLPLDALDLMRWRLVVPARMGETQALWEMCEAVRQMHEQLLDNARNNASQENQARQAGDLERMQECRMRSTIYGGAAECFTDYVTDSLRIWDQYNTAERPSEVISIGVSPGTPKAPPPLDMGDLRDPEATPREQLVAMVEQVISVRAHLAWSAIRRLTEADQGGGGSLRPDEDRAAASAMAQAADLLEAGLAAAAGRFKELGRHVVEHGRCLDQVI
ncbi:hypothetical protein [Spirillospora sp. CA-294931]|uniref:hypothetical protein n=1 Tax=Spirillospora sp. CA-294931 TaxID=3240042 RepID=UPI003D8EF9D7